MSMYDNGMNHPNYSRAEREHLDPDRKLIRCRCRNEHFDDEECSVCGGVEKEEE